MYQQEGMPREKRKTTTSESEMSPFGTQRDNEIDETNEKNK
jgi:hypothetical protein